MKLKKAGLSVLVVAASVCMSSCSLNLDFLDADSSKEKLLGQDVIETAMKKYNDQNSGGYEVTNEETGELQESFVYMYDEVGMLAYLYKGLQEDGTYNIEFNSGYEMYFEEKGVGRRVKKSESDFAVYNRDYARSDKTTAAVFFFGVDGVENVSSDTKDGVTSYCYEYDPEETEISIDGGKVEKFSSTYYFSGDSVMYYIQTTSGTMDNGESFAYSYRIRFIPSEDVTEIVNPIKVDETQDSSEE